MANQLSFIAEQLSQIGLHLQTSSPLDELNRQIVQLREQIAQTETHVEVINQPVPGVDAVLHKLAELFEVSFLPVFAAMEHKIRMEHDTWERVKSLTEEFKRLNLGNDAH